jgi:5-methyltetrahydrofolate--homocysteine methyltransferase
MTLFTRLGELQHTPCPKPDPRLPTVLIVSPQGDTHLLSLVVPEIILKYEGFLVQRLPEIEPNKLLQAVEKHSPCVLIITCLLDSCLPQIYEMLNALEQACFSGSVWVGGIGIKQRDFTRQTYSFPVMVKKNTVECAEGVGLPRQTSSATPSGKGNLKQPQIALNSPSEKACPPKLCVGGGWPAVALAEVGRGSPPIPLQTLWDFIPNRTLFTLHLGFKSFDKSLQNNDPEAVALLHQVERVKAKILEEGLLTPKAIWKDFHCTSEGNTITAEAHRLEFPRQHKPNGLCLADWVTPNYPTLTFFVTTAGDHHPTLKSWINQGLYQDAFIFHALAVQTAEAYAEYLHYTLRHAYNSAEPLPSHDVISKSLYTGKRFSFGYSACPDLSMQKKFFDILDPSPIGVSLTPTFMMRPEASVSAMVFYHPDARYFSAGG